MKKGGEMEERMKVKEVGSSKAREMNEERRKQEIIGEEMKGVKRDR